MNIKLNNIIINSKINHKTRSHNEFSKTATLVNLPITTVTLQTAIHPPKPTYTCVTRPATARNAPVHPPTPTYCHCISIQQCTRFSPPSRSPPPLCSFDNKHTDKSPAMRHWCRIRINCIISIDSNSFSVQKSKFNPRFFFWKLFVNVF